MVELEVNLLGKYQILVNSEIVTGFATDKTHLLLAYLALEANRPHPPQMLAPLLWSTWPEDVALTNLRQSLYQLRAGFDQHRPGLSDQIVRSSRHEIELIVPELRCDVTRFRQLATDACQHDPTELARSPTCRAAAEQATALYHGDLLAGYRAADAPAFEAWLTQERETLHHQMVTLLHTLCETYQLLGDHQQMYAHAARLIALEPWCEAAHRQIMRALAHGGQTSEAIAHYQQLRARLEIEMRATPDPATTALYSQIKQGAHASSASLTKLHRIPSPVTRFVGRETDITEITGRLLEPNCRLVTLLGPTGIGKTRLSIEIARRLAVQADYVDEIYYVPLAGMHHADALLPTIAARLEMTVAPDGDELSQIAEHLAHQRTLFVLDNFEHLAASGTQMLPDLLARIPGLALLVTAHNPLMLPGEHRFFIKGLACSLEQLSLEAAQNSPAVRLFTQSARRFAPGYTVSENNLDAVIQICRLLNGIPLALEIAATWVRIYDCAQIARYITTNLDSFVMPLHDVPARHRSLRAMLDHTWRMLSADDRGMLTKLAALDDYFDLERAGNVTNHPIPDIVNLVEKSLLQRVTSGQGYHVYPALRQFVSQPIYAYGG